MPIAAVGGEFRKRPAVENPVLDGEWAFALPDGVYGNECGIEVLAVTGVVQADKETHTFSRLKRYRSVVLSLAMAALSRHGVLVYPGYAAIQWCSQRSRLRFE
jgi:hypothetical protein